VIKQPIAYNRNVPQKATEFKFNKTLAFNGTWYGITELGTAGENIQFGDICYLNHATYSWNLADASNPLSSGGVKLGICVKSATYTQNTEMLLYGKVKEESKFQDLSAGSVCYVSNTTPGGILQGEAGSSAGQPTETDHVIRTVGYGSDIHELMFSPDNMYLTHI
jgi:hypothetical protein